jgi:hypothetical protein
MVDFEFFIKGLFSQVESARNNRVNYVVDKMPESEKEALYDYIKYFLSKVDGYDVQRFSLSAFPSVGAFISKVSELSHSSKRGILMVEGINTSDIELFNSFRYFLKEPDDSGFPAGWLILSLWDEKSNDLLDDGIRCTVSNWSYINYIKNGGESIASHLRSVKEP